MTLGIETLVRAIHPMAAEKLIETNCLIPQPTLNFQEKPLLCPGMRGVRCGLRLDNVEGVLVPSFRTNIKTSIVTWYYAGKAKLIWLPQPFQS